MFGRKKKQRTPEPVSTPEPQEKPTPAYLRDDYPYKAVGDPIVDMDTLEETGVIYEIKCPECEMAIRSQGVNIKPTYERLMSGNGCLGCGNKDLVVRRVDMSAAPQVPGGPVAAEKDVAQPEEAAAETSADAAEPADGEAQATE